MKLDRILIVIFVVLICFVAGFSWQDIKAGQFPSKDAFMRAISSSNPQQKLTPTQVFEYSYRKITKDYYKKVNSTDLKYAAMNGLFGSLGDPHTMFFEPKAAKEFQEETQGNIVGIGALLGKDPLGAKITKVYPNTPAAKTKPHDVKLIEGTKLRPEHKEESSIGLKDGDIITTVSGKSVAGMDIGDIVSKIRGPKDTPVEINVIRPKRSENIKFRIVRQPVTIPTVDSKVLPDSNIGYISVSIFSEQTADQFDKALLDLNSKMLNGLIIDLRWNPGGVLEVAKQMLSRFISDKKVVTLKFRGGKQAVESTVAGRAIELKYPIVVLVNDSSASAAEIMTGTLKDYNLITVVGERTYGKASVQVPFPLKDGAMAKVTIAKYYLPSGRDIGRKVDEDKQFISGGIKPDYVVSLDNVTDFEVGNVTKDPQLKKAVQVIEKKNEGLILSNKPAAVKSKTAKP